MKIREISFQESLEYRYRCNLLLVTATDIETEEVLKSLAPLANQDSVFKTYKGSLTYYMGAFGKYGAILVKSGMGTGRAGGAIISTQKAIYTWKPKAIVMIGIAFGVDRKEQRIGDVLVAEQIIPYDVKREGESIRIYRSEHPPSSLFLQNRFSQMKGEWSFSLPDGAKAQFSICPILSGEVLIDNKNFRDALISEFPKAKGGDMEATGIYVAASDEKIDWIVVKAVCDFADGDKKKNKQNNQSIAIKSAISLTKKVFSSQYAFEDLGLILSKTDNLKKNVISNSINISLQERLDLKDLVSSNEIERVFIKLKDILKNTNGNSSYDELITLQQDYNAQRGRERINAISIDKIREGDNQIAFGLLRLIDKL